MRTESSDGVRLPRGGHKRHEAAICSLSELLAGGGGGGRGEGDGHPVEGPVGELRPPASSHVGEPSGKGLLQPWWSLQMRQSTPAA